jgi:hypothetical protein
MLTLNSSVLKGIPTNAQLAITLLRIGEANHLDSIPLDLKKLAARVLCLVRLEGAEVVTH